MNESLIKTIIEIDEALRMYTSTYQNSTQLFKIPNKTASKKNAPFLTYDMSDVLLIGALTNSDVLLSGSTGCGKSHISRMVMNGLYGENGFANLTVTPGLSESDFIDIDIGAIKRGEKTLKEAIQKTPLLVTPGATIHEINRTPEILQNMFISYLERIFSLKGTEFPVGVAMKEGKDSPQDQHYQFRIISINEGADYSGTSGIDRAVRDRVVLEIPMDYFRPTKTDSREMINTRNHADLSIEKVNGGRLAQILDVNRDMVKIPLSISAEEFLVYLQGMDNCIMSQTYSKRGINFSPKDLCTGCHHTKDQFTDKEMMCGSVYAPSNRSIINLKKISKMVALMRTCKTIDAISRSDMAKKEAVKTAEECLKNMSVTVDDVAAVAPFVLTSKMLIDPRWIAQHYQGSKYLATGGIIYTAIQKFRAFVQSPAYTALMKANGEMTSEVRKQLDTYAKDNDPWAHNLGDNSTTQTSNERRIELTDLI